MVSLVLLTFMIQPPKIYTLKTSFFTIIDICCCRFNCLGLAFKTISQIWHLLLWFWRYLTYLSIKPSIYFTVVWLWNHAPIHSWNQPVLSNKGEVSCSRKQRGLWSDSNSWPTHYKSDALHRPLEFELSKGLV